LRSSKRSNSCSRSSTTFRWRGTRARCSPPTRVADGTIETLGGLDNPPSLLGEIYLAHATLIAATTCQGRLFRLQALEVRQSPSSVGSEVQLNSAAHNVTRLLRPAVQKNDTRRVDARAMGRRRAHLLQYTRYQASLSSWAPRLAAKRTPPSLVMGGEEDPRRKVDCRSRVLPFTALNWITDSVGRRHGALLTQDPFEESYCFS
jgi:hypothetical protein